MIHSPMPGNLLAVPGAGGDGVEAPVDEHAEARLAPPGHAGVALRGVSVSWMAGALLGDRIRMQGFAGDAGCVFRSMASRGAMGGVARAAADVCCGDGGGGAADDSD
jgi:LAO/AO transport system kinase